MSKKSTYKENDKECPICGGLIWGKGIKVSIEGAIIKVCQNCAQYGKKIHENVPLKYSKSKAQAKSKSIQKNRFFKFKDSLEPSEEIINDFAKRIKITRTTYNLTQEQFAQKLNEKPSLLRRIESGKTIPTLKLAKKIEQVYNIKLTQDGDQLEANVADSRYFKKKGGASLGDIAFIKKKKK